MLRSLRPYQVVVDVTAAVLFALVAAPVEVALVQFQGIMTAVGALVVVAVLSPALALRRIAPGIALGVAWAGAIVQMLTGLDPSLVDVAIFAVLYATAAYGDRIAYWAGFASAFAGAIVITAYLLVLRTMTGLTLVEVPFALALLFAATLALLLAWGVRAIRGLTVQVQTQADHASRLGDDLDRGMRQLTKRAQANDVRTVRMRDSLREIEARLAVVSSASASANAVRARLAAADAASEDD